MKSHWAILFAVVFTITSRGLAVQPPAARAAQNSPARHQSRQLQSELLKLYFVRARTQDLLDLLQAAKWKMTDAERSSFQQKAAAAKSQLQILENWRYQFQYHPQNAGYGQKTLQALEDLIPELRDISEAAAHYQNKTAAAQLERAAKDLSGLRDGIHSGLVTEFPGRFAPVTASTRRPVSSANPRTSAQTAPIPPLSSTVPASRETRPTSETIAASGPATSPPLLKPEQVQKMLLNVYLVSARINDLLSLAQPEKWKMGGGERAAIDAQLQSIRSGLANLEKWRYQFSYHLQDTASGDQTVAALATLLPQIQEVATAAGQFEGPSAAAQFEQPESQLAAFQKSIAEYVASLRAGYQRELAVGAPGSSSLPTERISVGAPPPPVQYLPGLTPPLSGPQVKAILYKIYVSVYRIHDLLTQERPGTWKAPKPTRAVDDEARATLLARIGELEKWRGLFSEYPDNMYDAFQTYRSVEDLFAPLDAFSEGVGQYESTSLASDYSRQAGDLQARLGDLIPYISFILKHESHSVALYQSDLAACQNRLSYAMHGFAHAAIPMRNILPDFKGRRVTRKRARTAGHRRSRRHAKKK
jgi:hypothetical protein